jgi:hypothetical protein
LEANIIGADAKGQHGAVNGAIGLMAQLRGMLINRTEIGGVGAFTPSAEEVVESVTREFGGEAAFIFSWMLGVIDDKELGPVPVDHLARLTLSSMPIGEALERLEQLREELVKVASDSARVVEAVEADRDLVDRQALTLARQAPRRREASRRP